MMHWLLILTLTYNGQTHEVPWALVPDADICSITGRAVENAYERAVPGLQATYSCAPEVTA